MKNATDNAANLIRDLTLEYNKLRKATSPRNFWKLPAANWATTENQVEDMNKGKIVQVIGPVVDVEFTDNLPGIYNALTVDFKVHDQPVKLTLEVQQHLGDNWVRTVAMSSTEGLKRGFEVIDTGAPISMPVGEGVMGRVFDVTGEPWTNAGRSRRINIIRSIARRRRWSTNRLHPRCSPPASRSST